MNISLIWSLLSHNQKKTFLVLIFLSIIVLFLEIISIGSIIPVIHSISGSDYISQFKTFEFIENIKFFNFIQFAGKYKFSIIVLSLVFIIIIIKNIFLSIFFWLEANFIFNVQETISKKLYDKLINKDYPFHLENNSANLITRIRTDSNLIREAISSLFSLCQSSIFVLGILFFLIYIEPVGFIITAFIFFLIGSLFFLLSSKKSIEIGRIRQAQEINRTKKLQESFGGIKEVKTFLKTHLFIDEYEILANKIAKTYALRLFITKLPKLFLETLTVLSIFTLVILMFLKASGNTEIFALLGVFAVSAIKVLPHLNSILNSFNTFKFSKEPVEYYEKYLKENIFKENENLEKINFTNDINFKDVSFKYPDKKENILEKINFTIKESDKISIRGKTGSGKSTLLDLILGLQKPSEGQIFIDGKNFNNNTKNDWLKNLGYVPQLIYLFDDTIKYNITLGEDKAKFDPEHFKRCLRISEINDFVDGLKDKENTLIGEHGSNISGGQRQRIGIARALYKNPKVIILDEATNALDEYTEINVFKNLINLKDKTLIVINHSDIHKKFNFRILNLEK